MLLKDSILAIIFVGSKFAGTVTRWEVGVNARLLDRQKHLTLEGRMSGIDAFLDRYAREPELVKSAITSMAQRKRRLRDGEFLCREGDLAECLWIIDDGIVVIGSGEKIVRRGVGELVGEIAFYRRGETRRSTSMRADGIVTIWEIDRSFLERLTPEQKSAWLETVAAVLAEKVIQATDHRARLLAGNVSLDHVLRRFVCDDGLMAVNAAFDSTASMNIIADQTVALLWFSDVAGFSSYSKDMPPAEAAKQMRRFMDIQVEEIQGAGGEIDKFMGDGLMAFWRLPDDDRIRKRVPKAIHAAIASISRIREIVQKEAIPLDIRIGLHLGPVVIGDFGGTGRIAYTLMGETVNSASRFEQARQDISGRPLGALRLSDTVFQHLHDERLLEIVGKEPRRFLAKHDREFIAYTSVD